MYSKEGFHNMNRTTLMILIDTFSKQATHYCVYLELNILSSSKRFKRTVQQVLNRYMCKNTYIPTYNTIWNLNVH